MIGTQQCSVVYASFGHVQGGNMIMNMKVMVIRCDAYYARFVQYCGSLSCDSESNSVQMIILNVNEVFRHIQGDLVM